MTALAFLLGTLTGAAAVFLFLLGLAVTHGPKIKPPAAPPIDQSAEDKP